MTCKAECDRKAVARGFCNTHWVRWRTDHTGSTLMAPIRQYGTPLDDHDTPDIPAAERRRQMKLMLVAAFGGKCSHCGGIFHPVCFDFHHLENKEAHISTLTSSYPHAAGFDRAAKEASKCEMVCANCHRLITFTEEPK